VDEVSVKGLVRENKALKRRLWLERSLFILLLAPVGSLWLLPRLASGPRSIQVDGRTVAVVESRAVAERVLTTVKRARAGAAAESAAFARPVTLARVGREAESPVAEEAAVVRLAAAVTVQAARTVILVDGTPRVALPDERAAAATLALVKSHYAGLVQRLAAEPRFKQQVTIAQRTVPTELWRPDPESAADFLIEGPATAPAGHTLAPGESFSGVAARYHLGLEELRRLNPDVRPSRLRPGETLNIRSPREAPITVIVRAQVRRIPRSLRTPGQRRGPGEVTYENGIAVAAIAVTKTPRLEGKAPHSEVQGGEAGKAPGAP
jgi:LysM repeat protein